MMKKVLLAIVIYIFNPVRLQAQELAFNKLTSEDGLLPGAVLAIAQDDKGFMWFGTQNGLNRFDTRRFKIYKHALQGKPFNDYITCLFPDSRKTLWVGTRNGLSRYRPESDSLEPVLFPEKSFGEHNLNISCLYEDRYKNIWVWSSAGLYRLANSEKPVFVEVPVPNNVAGLGGNSTRIIYQDYAGSYWIGSSAGLTCLEYKSGKTNYISFRHDDKDPLSISDNYVTAIEEDNEHRLWIGTLQGGINVYDRATRAFRHYRAGNTPGFVHDNIRTIKTGKSGKLWIGTQGGVSVYDPATGRFMAYRSIPDNIQSLSHNSVYSIFKDKDDNMWIGTYWGGVNSVSTDNTPFHIYKSNLYQPGINNNVVSAVLEDDNHNLWVGTEGGGVNYINRKHNTISYFQFNPADTTSLGSNLIKVIYKDKDGNIWVGTHGGGLNVFNPHRKSFTRFLYNEKAPVVRSSEVLSLLEDKDGIFWVGMQTRLLAFKRKGRTLQPLPENDLIRAIGRNSVRTIVQLKNGDIWAGTSNGLFCMQYATGTISSFTTANGLPENDINCIHQDHEGHIWIGCYFGNLALYIPSSETNRFTVYQKKESLADENVTAILDDEAGNLWISTGNGLCKFDVAKNCFKNYNKGDGLAGNKFNVGSCCKTQQGELFFGGYNGLTFFYPAAIKENPVPPVTFLTGLRLFNNPVAINKNQLLEKEIGFTQHIRFTHRQNVFTLEFASLNYNQPDKNTYAYKLEGFDQNWNYTATPSATYMNLPPGNYVFGAKGANNDGIWGPETRLQITVLPPFWKTIWAYMLYIVIIAAVVFFVIRFFVLRALIKRDRELIRLKLDFFTNISHDMRTHLSLIIGPVERLLLINREGENTKQLQTIKRNSTSLLNLVTEVMDFRKAESGSLILNIAEENIVSFVQDIFTSFYELSVTRNIKTDFSTSAPGIKLYFDRLQLEKVFYNLLNNAYKFTLPGGDIRVDIEEKADEVIIRVRDNGKGISPENLPRIFSNYFQEDDKAGDNKGYGIGLALAKSLIELHKGHITVESVRTAGGNTTTFTVVMKKGKAHFDNIPIAKVTTPLSHGEKRESGFEPRLLPVTGEYNGTTNADSNKKKYTVLLVEDNAELRSFVRGTLEKDYIIIESTNGGLGLEAAVTFIPDVIVSDVMMPEMDGYALCHRLKSDERTSHIPVILLTAMSSAHHQVSGLEKGADIYLTKPFSSQVLQLHISNLLRLREKIRNWVKGLLTGPQFIQEIKFNREVTSMPADGRIIDDAFLQKALHIVEDHIDDPEFDVDAFARILALSRPILYKKINAVAGVSVNDFIKSVRLNKAIVHLGDRKYNISEIAYRVGFSDPKYFSREFKKKFGKSPKEWRETD